MNVAGIDVSSHAIDVVWVPEEGAEAPQWVRWPLTGAGAWERCRDIGRQFPGPAHTVWDETTAIGIEIAFGPSSGDVNRCVGAVLSRLPYDLLVEPWPPSKWRKAVGLSGNASKDDVFRYSCHAYLGDRLAIAAPKWPQDAHDAHLIALATRQALNQQEAA